MIDEAKEVETIMKEIEQSKQASGDSESSEASEPVNDIPQKLYEDYLKEKKLRPIAQRYNISVKDAKQQIIDYCNDNNIKVPSSLTPRKGAPEPANVLPKKDGSGAEKIITELNAETVSNNIFGIHQILAMMVTPEFAIGKDEAKVLGEAVYNVIKDYNLEFLNKYSKYIDLIFAVAVVEVPVGMRVSAAIKKKKTSKKADKEGSEAIGADSKKAVQIAKELGVAQGEPLK